MSTKYVMRDTVRKIEHRVASRWLGGVGKDAKFAEDSEGYWAVFDSCPASIHLGIEEPPDLKAGDRVRLTLERD